MNNLPVGQIAKEVMKIIPATKGLGAITHPILANKIQKDFRTLLELFHGIYPFLSDEQTYRLNTYKDLVNTTLAAYHNFAQFRIYKPEGRELKWRGETHPGFDFTDDQIESLKTRKPHNDVGVCKAYISLINELMDCMMKTLYEINSNQCDRTPVIKEIITFYHNSTIMGKVLSNL